MNNNVFLISVAYSGSTLCIPCNQPPNISPIQYRIVKCILDKRVLQCNVSSKEKIYVCLCVYILRLQNLIFLGYTIPEYMYNQMG